MFRTTRFGRFSCYTTTLFVRSMWVFWLHCKVFWTLDVVPKKIGKGHLKQMKLNSTVYSDMNTIPQKNVWNDELCRLHFLRKLGWKLSFFFNCKMTSLHPRNSSYPQFHKNWRYQIGDNSRDCRKCCQNSTFKNCSGFVLGGILTSDFKFFSPFPAQLKTQFSRHQTVQQTVLMTTS